MATQSGYTPEVVDLSGGLDFVTPRPRVAPGSLIDCYNFEVADRLGYKSIDGVEPFDGSFSISNVYSLLYTSDYVSTGVTNLAVGQGLYLDGETSQQTFAIITSFGTNTVMGIEHGTISYYITDVGKFFYSYTNPAFPIHNSVSTPVDITITNTELAYQFTGKTTITEALSVINVAYGNAFGTIQTCVTESVESPGIIYYNPSIGLTWFKEQLYSVNDLNSVLFDTGTTQFYPGDYIGVLGNGFAASYRIRDVILLGGDWTTGDASGKLLYSNLSGHIGGNIGASDTIYIYPNTTTTTPSATGAIARDTLSATIPATQQAGLFRSYNIDQVDPVAFPNAEQEQGWKEVDLGYIAGYENGNTGSNDPSGFTKVGRDPNPPASGIVPTAYAFPATATNLVDSLTGTTVWVNQPAASFPSNIETQNDGNYIYTESNSSGVAQLGLVNFGFTDLPTDALITGLELTLCASALPKATTAATFVLPAPATPVTVTVTTTSGLGAGKAVRITDGTHTVTGTVSSTLSGPPRLVFSSGVFINAGTAGDTMASGATVNYAITNRKLNASLSTSSGTSKQTPSIVAHSTSATDTFVMGGSNDLWGATNLRAADLQDSAFQVALWASGNGNGGAGLLQEIDLDVVKMRVYYQTSSSVYYFYNGTDDVSGTVTTYSLDSGSWSLGTAAGVLQVANVAGYNGATRNTIFGGDQIWTAPAGTGVHIADVATTMTYAGLPSQSLIQAQNSQYEFIEADFYGNTDWEAIYGVSGAGRAFTYDTFYFRYIYTGLNSTLDIPRHLAFHNFHLALGYPQGNVSTSVTGEPENFSGLQGAATFGTGDPVMGLLRMSGTTLGIFCKRSIQALNGTDNTNFSQSVLNPYEGAIEYTVIDCGKPVYASYRGISTFDQANTYSNFLGNRLSASITPWLLPRLVGIPQPITAQNNLTPVSRGPLFAMAIRNKNQYRLWFGDGTYLTLTLMGANQDPVFTIQQVNFNYTNTVSDLTATRVAVPLAHSSSIDNNGRDRNHFSIYNPARGRVSLATDYANYVWEIDRGWGFGTEPIRAWFTTTHNFFDNPFELSNVRKIRLHGQSLGAAAMTIAVSSDYLSSDFQFGQFSAITNAPPQDMSMPRDGFNQNPMYLTTDFQPQTNIADVAKFGRSFSMQFVIDAVTIQPPVVCQALLIQTTVNKADT